MKRFLNGKMRMLSLLLSLVLVVGLMPLVAVRASAAGNSFSYAYDCSRTPDWPQKGSSFTAGSIEKPYNNSQTQIDPFGAWDLTSKGYWTSDMCSTLGANRSFFDPVIRKVASSYKIQPSQVEVYELTKDGTHIAYGAIFARSSNAGEIATFLGDNWNTDGCTYLLSDTELTLGSSITVTIDQDLTTNAPASHTHSWTPATSGNGTNQAATVITCSGCSETMTVTLTASNVTLPGDVFTAKISTETGISPITRSFQLSEGLTVSETPGYKYSATGSDFTSIDPNNFTPKQGIYQASILVNGAGWNQPENLYVTYTVSDPAVTAATGDNRPIEMMVMGMACFSILAIAAFVLDGKRKARR